MPIKWGDYVDYKTADEVGRTIAGSGFVLGGDSVHFLVGSAKGYQMVVAKDECTFVSGEQTDTARELYLRFEHTIPEFLREIGIPS